MSEKNIALLKERQAFLILFTQQLILHSQNKVNELETMIQAESKKISSPAPPQQPAAISKIPSQQQTPIHQENIQENGETNKSEAIREEDQEPMIKSIMARRPWPPEKKEKSGVSAIKPVEIKTPRREVSPIPRRPARVLKIPEPRLPEEFQHLRPMPMQKEIDLAQLNPFIYDPAVRMIECPGPDKSVFVSGTMGRKPTNLMLSNEEVEDIIKRFSAASKIPAENGIYKVVVGRLIFSAIISDVIPSRFTIRKMVTANPIANPYQKDPNYNLFFGKRR